MTDVSNLPLYGEYNWDDPIYKVLRRETASPRYKIYLMQNGMLNIVFYQYTDMLALSSRAGIDFDDLHGADGYDRWEAYAQSKLANVLFAYELDRRLKGADADVASLACHPGYAATNLQTTGPEMEGSTLRKVGMRVANAVLAQDAATGALPMLYAATAPDAEGGGYYGPGGLMNMRGYPEPQQSSERSYDREAARRLWRVSEDLTGVTYDLPAPEAAVAD